MPQKIKNTVAAALMIVWSLSVISVPVLGHHGTNVSYDHSKKITLKGTVTEFQFRNPHIQIYFDVKDQNGNVSHWAAEGGGLYFWTSFGFKRDSLKPGDEITITVAPSKSGAQIGVLELLVFPDGRKMGLNAPPRDNE
jgi:hypothetical protein